jgi:hypothetical protein
MPAFTNIHHKAAGNTTKAIGQQAIGQQIRN